MVPQNVPWLRLLSAATLKVRNMACYPLHLGSACTLLIPDLTCASYDCDFKFSLAHANASSHASAKHRHLSIIKASVLFLLIWIQRDHPVHSQQRTTLYYRAGLYVFTSGVNLDQRDAVTAS